MLVQNPLFTLFLGLANKCKLFKNAPQKEENVCINGMLQLCLKLKNITVFSGWDDNNMIEGDPHREFDFLIVSDLSKTIIHIEVKHSNQENNKPLKKAIKQVIYR